jgi:hypothetical protein
VAVITTLGRTLDRNVGSLNEVVGSTDRLFAAAHLAYDPVHNWLNLNDQSAPGMTAGVVEGLVRDRLAGVCRRLLAHHSAGLDQQALATLASCGNPDSGFFDPVLGLIQRVLAGLPAAGPSSNSSALSSLSSAVATIPGLTPAQRSLITHDIASPPSSTARPATSRRKKRTVKSIDQTVDSLLGPLPALVGASSGGGTSGATGTTGTTGTGGLLGSATAAGAQAPGWGTPGTWASYLSLFLGGRV